VTAQGRAFETNLHGRRGLCHERQPVAHHIPESISQTWPLVVPACRAGAYQELDRTGPTSWDPLRESLKLLSVKATDGGDLEELHEHGVVELVGGRVSGHGCEACYTWSFCISHWSRLRGIAIPWLDEMEAGTGQVRAGKDLRIA
jgi:hypothetical protein